MKLPLYNGPWQGCTIFAMTITIPALLILIGFLLYFPNWGWKGTEIKEVGRILLFWGVFMVAFQLKGSRLL